MKAFKSILAGGAGLAALATAAPASAQYYPSQGANVVGQVLGQILGGNVGYGSRGGYGGYGGGYGAYGGSQMAVNQCASAVSQRLGGGYGGYGYGGGARVQIQSVEPRSSGKMRVRGFAQTNAGYGQTVAFKCNVDYSGRIRDLDFDRMSNRHRAYGYNQGYGTYRRY
jgi:hypothetical protein